MRRLLFLLLAVSLSAGSLPVPATAQQRAPSVASQPASSPGTTQRAVEPKSLAAGTERISAMGPDGDPAFDALHPAVTYNPASGEYFVVWAGTDDEGALVAGETEIYGQRVDPVSAQPIGGRVRLSEMGVDGDPSFSALRPAVVYNPVRDDYLVVWQGSAGAGEFEIYGRTVGGSDLALGATQRLTQVGTDGDPAVQALAPSLAVSTTTGAYYLAWYSNADGQRAVYGRVLDASGQATGGGPETLSTAGPSGDAGRGARHPAAAYDPATGTYWVAWSGSDDGAGLAAGELEIFLRQVGADGTPAGTGARRISQVGSDGDAAIDAVRPSLVADASAGEVFVVWSANAPDGSGAFEVYAQRIDPATGAEVGTDDLRLSTMGADGATAFSGFAPMIAGSPGREYQVIWRGDDTVDDAFELYAQAVFADRSNGDEGPDDDVLLTGLSNGTARLGAVTAAVARSTDDTYLVVWSGDTVGDGLVKGEHEIFGRIVGDGNPLPVELVAFRAAVTGDAIRLSWQTLSETNSDRFEVQRRGGPRSADAAGTWATIGTVRAAGNASGPVDYRFTDTRLPYAADEVVYRLRQVDVDGTGSLSDEVRVARGVVSRLEMLAAFPNPARTAATVRLAVPDALGPATDVQLALYDVLGRRVRAVSIGERRGRQEVHVDVNGLASGVYFLRLEAGGQNRTQRITVVR
jgi:hypothetical protein